MVELEELERIRSEIRRLEDQERRRNRKLLPGERVDVQRLRRQDEKWRTIRSSAPTLKCPDCRRGPILARQSWCIVRGMRDKGGPPRVTCKGCIRTKWKRFGNRFVKRDYAQRREGPMIVAVIRYQFPQGQFLLLREQTGLSQSSMAVAAGCTRGLIRRMEDIGPLVELKIEQLVQFKEAFEGNGVEVQELVEVIARHYGDAPDDPDDDTK